MLVFLWQILEANLTDNSKIGNELYLFGIRTSVNLFCSNSSLILELSVKFASQICHENTNTPLDGAYLADFVIVITKCKVRARSGKKSIFSGCAHILRQDVESCSSPKRQFLHIYKDTKMNLFFPQ